MEINIAKDFTDAPGGRYKSDGRFSGEEFRLNYLEPAFKKENEEITINLDGTFGFATSFLEEAFGGLVRIEGIKKEDILKRLKYISNEDPSLITKIRQYIEEAND
ncbi:MAG: hypothetical protein HW406_1750 [Candidatus Brocadiaceae bacterium]|nr:hypothetical protein [Candidatus Brocadiaceae bacterium]